MQLWLKCFQKLQRSNKRTSNSNNVCSHGSKIFREQNWPQARITFMALSVCQQDVQQIWKYMPVKIVSVKYHQLWMKSVLRLVMIWRPASGVFRQCEIPHPSQNVMILYMGFNTKPTKSSLWSLQGVLLLRGEIWCSNMVRVDGQEWRPILHRQLIIYTCPHVIRQPLNYFHAIIPMNWKQWMGNMQNHNKFKLKFCEIFYLQVLFPVYFIMVIMYTVTL